MVGYEIGRGIGPPLYEHEGRIIKRKYFDKTAAFFDRHGNKALVIGRFVPFVRTYITVVAGVTRMKRHRFFLWSAVGAGAWVLSITLLGYFLGPFVPGARREHRQGDHRHPRLLDHPDRLRVVEAPPARRRAGGGPEAPSRPAPRRAAPWSAPDAPPVPRRPAGCCPSGLRSIAHTTVSTTAPAARSASVASRTAPPVVITSSTSVTRRPATSGPSASLQVPYSLAVLRTNSAGRPVRELSTVAIGTPPELEAAEELGVVGDQADHLLDHPGQQRGIGLEEVLVEVLRGDLAGPQGERPGQAAARVDVAGEVRIVEEPVEALRGTTALGRLLTRCPKAIIRSSVWKISEQVVSVISRCPGRCAGCGPPSGFSAAGRAPRCR